MLQQAYEVNSSKLQGRQSTHINVIRDSRLQNQLDIGVVIDIRASGHHDHLVGHFDVLSTAWTSSGEAMHTKKKASAFLKVV